MSVITGGSASNVGLAETAVQAWVQTLNAPNHSGFNYAYKVAVDGNGNVIVAGSLRPPGMSSEAMCVVKYSTAGVPLWTNYCKGTQFGSTDQARSCGLDSNGNVFATGFVVNSASGFDYVTLAYSPSGAPLWTNYYNGPGNGTDEAVALAIGTNGNVIVTGYSATAGTLYDYATIAYSNAGLPLWTNRYGGFGNGGAANAVAADTNGNVLVTGYSLGNGSGNDYATVAYSATGQPLWTNRYNGSGNGDDEATAVAVDKSGNVYVTGYSQASVGGTAFATIAYSAIGTALWTNRYHGPGNGNDHATALAVDDSGNVFVTGYSYGFANSIDYATIKYSSTGTPIWSNRYNGPANGSDQANAIGVDRDGNVLVTGYSAGIGSGSDYATISYSASGLPLWTNRYAGPSTWNDSAISLAPIPNGSVVTGVSSPGTSYDIVTVKCVATVNLSVKLTNGNVNVSWPLSHTGWRLQMQTNLPNGGIGSNWMEVTGATATNSVYLPASSTSSTFFRLAYPY